MKCFGCKKESENFDKACKTLIKKLKKSDQRISKKVGNSEKNAVTHMDFPRNFKLLNEQDTETLLRFVSRKKINKDDNFPAYMEMVDDILRARNIQNQDKYSQSIKWATLVIAFATFSQLITTIFIQTHLGDFFYALFRKVFSL